MQTLFFVLSFFSTITNITHVSTPVPTLLWYLYSSHVQPHASISTCTLNIQSAGSHTIIWIHKNTAHTGENGYHCSCGCSTLTKVNSLAEKRCSECGVSPLTLYDILLEDGAGKRCSACGVSPLKYCTHG